MKLTSIDFESPEDWRQYQKSEKLARDADRTRSDSQIIEEETREAEEADRAYSAMMEEKYWRESLSRIKSDSANRGDIQSLSRRTDSGLWKMLRKYPLLSGLSDKEVSDLAEAISQKRRESLFRILYKSDSPEENL